MTDIHTRPFSKNYSGLINQSVIAIGITVICITGHEVMKRRRRGRYNPGGGLGSRESWECGYLYQGRSWARWPSPPSPAGWPLSWVKQVVTISEEKMHELRGVDATLYIRFLRGCFWFAALQSITTFPILFPIHVKFSDAAISPKSMTRASISSLVGTSTGLSLLWIHICLLFWITLSWMTTLLWICHGAFKLRLAGISRVADQVNSDANDIDATYYPHPHPQYGFADIPLPDRSHPNRGLRLRTVMVSNLPTSLRNEKDLKEYFEYYMTRKVHKPSMGLTSSTQPGFLNKSFAFLFNRAKRIPAHINPLLPNQTGDKSHSTDGTARVSSGSDKESPAKPIIERVVIARKMTELASLLERREEILRLLETAHIKLANRTLLAVKVAMERQSANKPLSQSTSKAAEIARKRRSIAADLENGGAQEDPLDEEARMERLIKVLGPFVEEFELQESFASRSRKAITKSSKHAFRKLRTQGSESDNSDEPSSPEYPPVSRPKRLRPQDTVWDVLLSLPRSSLDAYQPLVNLNHLFRGQTVPSIDYYTAKLNLLTSLITEHRAKAQSDFESVSTAFVTFADPADARRACKYLAVHPNNPLACLVTMAPMYNDLDWNRVMKSSFRVEFVKDWVVNLGVWGFTLFWIFPVSLLVGLVSIQNISLFWPSLKRYLDRHAWESEVIQSFLPTLLVALLALLIPLILLLIAKKAHTITTLSALHDLIMTRYYKFLVVNVLIFFCVGTAALQSFLQSFRSTARPDVLEVIADSFPTAGPFYVGWLIFTTAMHGGFELALLGLPLIMYPTTRRQVTPRKRAVGIRPRTFNFYYWLPNHVLVIHVLLLFSVLNPFVLPFGTLYFFIQSGVVKNSLIHVYAKNYEGKGQLLLIRIVRYSLDGLVLAQAVFLAYMVVLKKTVNVGLAAFLIALTITVKVLMTRMCRAQFEHQDILEAEVLCNNRSLDPLLEGGENMVEEDPRTSTYAQGGGELIQRAQHNQRSRLPPSITTWRLPGWLSFTYSSMKHRPRHVQRRPPNPFRPHAQSLPRLNSALMDHQTQVQTVDIEASSPQRDPPTHTTAARPLNYSPLHLDGRPVVPHPPPSPWDDQGTPDLPYDNPFYSRAIDNALWLPRNPCGVLDLDDTVDMKISMTVEPSGGQLGPWSIGILSESPGEMSQAPPSPMTTSPEQSALIVSPSFPRVQEVDGTEEIELPLTIAKRVQAGEEDVEQATRPRGPSGYRRKLSGAEKSILSFTSGPGRRLPSVLDGPPVSPFRSVSDSKEGHGRRPSIMSTLQPPILHRARSSDHAEANTLALADPISDNASTSRTSLAPPHQQAIRSSRSQNLSARQAIFHEVLAEEQVAHENRIEEEEAQAARTNKSWLTSWMFEKMQ